MGQSATGNQKDFVLLKNGKPIITKIFAFAKRILFGETLASSKNCKTFKFRRDILT